MRKYMVGVPKSSRGGRGTIGSTSWMNSYPMKPTAPPVKRGKRRVTGMRFPCAASFKNSSCVGKYIAARIQHNRVSFINHGVGVRVTNAFSKMVENHAAAIALHFMHYNFARIHQTLRITPAMGAGVTDHAWTLEEVVGLV